MSSCPVANISVRDSDARQTLVDRLVQCNHVFDVCKRQTQETRDVVYRARHPAPSNSGPHVNHFDDTLMSITIPKELPQENTFSKIPLHCQVEPLLWHHDTCDTQDTEEPVDKSESRWRCSPDRRCVFACPIFKKHHILKPLPHRVVHSSAIFLPDFK